ncbi:MAG TPA: prolipoprotein diacylglyceryl transferase [Chryseosolibacter sp.]|nr:prolipoprotein diacylglyceryl transferase [Chryseosolibacter sp.]
MHPVIFEVGSFTLYSYGMMIAVGILAGMAYLIVAGKKELGLTFDQANTLFLWVFLAAVVGGKLFLFFEDPGGYIVRPGALLSGRGFVFYGSFLLAVPVMWIFFKRHNLPVYQMLDIMAITTCLVHMFGRIGCFLAGCCYGKPTESALAVVFTNPVCYAQPLNTPLYPTQLMEAGYILAVMLVLLWMKRRRRFHGQLFLSYLMLYAFGRFVLEFFRGDVGRGFVIQDYMSHSQFIALSVAVVVAIITALNYRKARHRSTLTP